MSHHSQPTDKQKELILAKRQEILNKINANKQSDLSVKDYDIEFTTKKELPPNIYEQSENIQNQRMKLFEKIISSQMSSTTLQTTEHDNQRTQCATSSQNPKKREKSKTKDQKSYMKKISQQFGPKQQIVQNQELENPVEPQIPKDIPKKERLIQETPCAKASHNLKESQSVIEFTTRQEQFLNQKKQKMQKLKHDIEKSQQEVCTFKPLTNALNQPSSETTPYERLNQEAMIRKFKEEKQRRDYECEKLKDCTFKPQINEKSKVMKRQNSYVNKRSNKENIINNQEEQENCYFKPQINQKSRQIAQRNYGSYDNQSVHNKLYNQAQEKIEAQIQLQQSISQQEFNQYYNKNLSSYELSEVDQKEIFEEFLRRQNQFEQSKQQKLIGHQIQKSEYTFEPEINEVSRAILTSFNDNYANVYDRLTNGNNGKSSQALTEVTLDRVPQINQASKIIARERDTFKELTNVQSKFNENQKNYIQEKMKECTFTPQINDITSEILSFNSNYYDLRTYKLKREEWIQNQVTQKIHNQLKECTFTPQTTTFSGLKQPDQDVKGLERFYMLKDMKEKQKNEIEKRKKEVFRDGSNYGKDQIIVAQEPVLETHKRAKNKPKKFQQIDEECTFKPMTNYRQNIDLIHELI